MNYVLFERHAIKMPSHPSEAVTHALGELSTAALRLIDATGASAKITGLFTGSVVRSHVLSGIATNPPAFVAEYIPDASSWYVESYLAPTPPHYSSLPPIMNYALYGVSDRGSHRVQVAQGWRDYYSFRDGDVTNRRRARSQELQPQAFLRATAKATHHLRRSCESGAVKLIVE